VSTHPNVILLLLLTPEDTSRKTMRAILAEAGVEDEDRDIKIGDKTYHHKVFEEDYDDDWQIAAKEGDLAFFDLVTYGYGEAVTWESLNAQKLVLEEWAKDICARHRCSYEIRVTANYW
jgi:hypothetical protein